MKRLTRRSLLKTAAAASVAGLGPWSAATAEAAVPAYLRRSTYLRAWRWGYSTRIDGRRVALRLVSARGREDAFALTFAGPVGIPLASEIHRLRHPELGTFALFLSPVQAVRGDRRYEAVIDRRMSVARARRRAPRRRGHSR